MSNKIDNQTFFNENQTPNWDKAPIVVAWQFSSAENLGALLRVCDNFGVNEVFFVGDEADYKHSRIKRNATTSIKKIDWKFVTETELWSRLPSDIMKIAVDTTSTSVELSQYDFNTLENPFCLFFGNETIGIEDEVFQKCDASIHIPMIGNSFSMNVVQAASVTLYEAVRQCLLSD
jgi:tRNA (guanosine-2'-O-)-methyltransferase